MGDEEGTAHRLAILCVIVIGITAVALDSLLRFAERRLVPWKGRA